MKTRKTLTKLLYQQNDFLVIKDKTAKDNFILALVKKDIHLGDKLANVLLMVRDKDKTVHDFVPTKEEKIDPNLILFKAEDVQVFEPKEKTGGSTKKKDFQISLKRRVYNYIKAKVEENLSKENEESDEEEEDLSAERQSAEMQKLKQEEVLNKLVKSKRGKAPSRSVSKRRSKTRPQEADPSPGSEDVEFGADEPTKIRADSIPPALFGRKKKQSKSQSVARAPKASKPRKTPSVDQEASTILAPKIPIKGRSKKPPKAPPTFKKGVFNLNAKMMPKSNQYEGSSEIFDSDCCINCTNKEFVRAAKTNNLALVSNILNILKKAQSLLDSKLPDSCVVPQGPRSCQYPFALAIKNNNKDMIMSIFNFEKNKPEIFERNRKIQFQFVNTGENDKYAYGVKTREVEMARAGREGTNAFLYDQYPPQTSLSAAGNITQLCRLLKNEELFIYLLTSFPEFDSVLKTNFWQIVEQGNLELAIWVAKHINDCGGLGFNVYHYLALVAKEPNELTGMLKQNAKKKVYGNRGLTPLHLACVNPNPCILAHFLDIGKEIHIADEFGRKLTHYAAMNQSTVALRFLLDNFMDCRDFDRFRNTPMIYAAIADRPENIKMMAQHVEYDLKHKNKDSNAAIHVAVQNQSLQALKTLLQLGADKNLTGKNKMTPLMMACEIDCFEAVEMLVEAGAKIVPSDKFRKTALHHAAVSGNLKTLTYLLSKGAEMNKADSSGNTALHFACAYGHYEMIDVLISAGANINVVNSWNLQPILVAMMKNHYRCVKVLVEYQGIDVNCQDSNGNSLIMNCLAQFTEISFSFCKYLITEKGAKVNLTDGSGNNIIHKLAMKKLRNKSPELGYKEAKKKYSEEIALYKSFFELLTSKSSDLNQRNLKEFTPLEIAFEEENWLFVEQAIGIEGFDFVTPNSKGRVVLSEISAAFFHKNGLKIAEAVINRQPDIKRLENLFDDQGLNFYHQATLLFITNCRNNPLKDYYDQKMIFYEKCKSFAAKLDDQPTIKILDTKMLLVDKKRNEGVLKAQKRFQEFSAILYAKNFDFFVRVEVKLTPWSEWIAKSKKQSLINKAKNTRNPSRYRNLSYNRKWKDQSEQQEPELDEKNNWVEFVVNDRAGCTLFHLLMVNPIESILPQMLEYSLKDNKYIPNEMNYFGESVFLHMARNYTQPSEVPKILQIHGENPNFGDTHDNFPLLITAKNNNRASLESFLKMGVKLDVQGPDGETALIYFAKNRMLAEAELLLKHGANPNTCDKSGRNALHWAINNNVEQDKNFEFENLLIKYQIELNKLDNLGRQPIHYFFVKIDDLLINSKKDPIEICADLLNSGEIEFDTPDNFGNTPLCYAAQRGAYLCFGTLVKRRADINHVNKDGNCPLTIALLNDQPEVAVFCLQKGVIFNRVVYDVNYQAYIRLEKLKEDLAKAIEINDGKNNRLVGIERPGTVRESNVLNFIKVRRESAKLIVDYGDLNQSVTSQSEVDLLRPFTHYNAPILQATEYKAINEKPTAELTIAELKQLQANKFLKRKMTIFSLAIQKRFDAVDYLLIDGGLNIGSAIIDTLESVLFKYTIKLLLKKNATSPNFCDQFSFQNDKNQTLAHIFGKNSVKMDDSTASTILTLMLEKRVQINNPDIYGVTPLMYLAYHSKNIKMIALLIEKGANWRVQDKGNNWLVSCYIQDNKLLRIKNETEENPKPAPRGTRKRIPPGFPKSSSEMFNMLAEEQKLKTASAQSELNILAYKRFMMQKIKSTPSNPNINSMRPENPLGGVFTSPERSENISDIIQSDLMPFARAETTGGQQTLTMPIAIQEEENPPVSNEIVLPAPIQEAFDFITLQLKTNQGLVNSRFDPFLDSKRGLIKPQKNTLLSYSIKDLRNLALAQLLINCGANINSQDDKGFTVLTWAIRENQTEIVRFLLAFPEQIDFNHQDKEKKTYLHHIVSPMTFASYENVELLDLFGHKVNINKLDKYGRPAMYYAKLQASGRMFKKLKMMNALDIEEGVEQDMPLSVLADKNFYENSYDFEDDHAKAVEEAEKLLKDKKIDVVEKPKPNELIVGQTVLVMDPSGKPYDVKLIKVEIRYGRFSENVFYIMQIVFDEIRKIYVLFTNWGRVGNDGQYQQTPFFRIDEAVKEFNKVFKEKTGNDYESRDKFVKKTGKYQIVHTQPRPVSRVIVNLFDPNFIDTKPPQIPRNLVELMKNLADQKMLNMVYRNMNLDPNMMPFGSLSQSTIKKAKDILADIAVMTQNLESNQKNMSTKELFAMWMEINDKASRYLELIPTVGNKQEQIPQFSIRRVNDERIRLKDLENLELVSRVLGAATYRIKSIYPYEYCLRSLEIKIHCLEEKDEEYELISRYFHASRTSPEVSLCNVYAVERKGENKAFKQYEEKQNRRFLWHGTRTENVMGILQQGLRIKPSEAMLSGSRLGDGLYFSDLFKRAAEFSSSIDDDSSSTKAYALVCEVFLGNMKKVYNLDNIKPLGNEFQSLKAKGRNTPDKSQRVYLASGTMIPIGKSILKDEIPPKAEPNTYYQFSENEYTVYNESQVKIRYLVEFCAKKRVRIFNGTEDSLDEDNIWSG